MKTINHSISVHATKLISIHLWTPNRRIENPLLSSPMVTLSLNLVDVNFIFNILFKNKSSNLFINPLFKITVVQQKIELTCKTIA